MFRQFKYSTCLDSETVESTCFYHPLTQTGENIFPYFISKPLTPSLIPMPLILDFSVMGKGFFTIYPIYAPHDFVHVSDPQSVSSAPRETNPACPDSHHNWDTPSLATCDESPLHPLQDKHALPVLWWPELHTMFQGLPHQCYNFKSPSQLSKIHKKSAFSKRIHVFNNRNLTSLAAWELRRAAGLTVTFQSKY